MRGSEIAIGGAALVGLAWWLGSSSAAASSTSSAPSLPADRFGLASSSSSAIGGRALVTSWPNAFSQAREAAIWNAVNAGQTRSITWTQIVSQASGRTLSMLVMDDVLAVGTDDDWVRINCTHRTAELIARSWPDANGGASGGAYLCTSKIADLIAEYAAPRITPTILSGLDQFNPVTHPGAMSSTTAMLANHDSIEAKRAGRAGLISDAGKYWVNTPRLGTPAAPAPPHGRTHGIAAANYGLFMMRFDGSYEARGAQGTPAQAIAGVGPGSLSHGPGGYAVEQNVGLAHSDTDHTDYSQTLRMVARWGELDGVQIDLADVASDPQLCALVSDEGPVLLRHPGITPGTQF